MKKRQIFLLSAVAVLWVAGLAAIWEFVVGPLLGPVNLPPEFKVRMITESTVFAALGLLMPAYMLWRISRGQRRAEDDRQKSEKRFHDIAEAASDWLWEMGSDLRFSYISDRFYELNGIRPTAIVGKTRWEFAGAETVALAPETWEVHKQVLQNRKPFRDFIYPVRNPAGGTNYISLSGKPVYDERGNFAGYCGTGSEISELFDTREHLIQARDEAEAANRAKSEFLASMSHELRTPMNAIIGFGEMMTYNPTDPLSGKNKEHLGYILTSASHLLSLINQVLELAQIESGRVELVAESITIQDIMPDIIHMIEGAADKKGVKICESVCSCKDGRTFVYADPLRFKQVIFNLLSNAVKYNRPGGRVEISCSVTGDGMTRISVADTGIGIPAEKHQDVFEPFNRLGLEARNIEGSGIGLTITRDLVEQMGGRIDFSSKAGDGTTFWVEFPAIKPVPATLRKPPKLTPVDDGAADETANDLATPIKVDSAAGQPLSSN